MTFACAEHSNANAANFSINQSRIFSRLNTIFVVFNEADAFNQREINTFIGKQTGPPWRRQMTVRDIFDCAASSYRTARA